MLVVLVVLVELVELIGLIGLIEHSYVVLGRPGHIAPGRPGQKENASWWIRRSGTPASRTASRMPLVKESGPQT